MHPPFPSRVRVRPRWLAAGWLAGLVACGGGSSGGGEGTAGAPAVDAVPTVRLDAPAARADGLSGTLTLAATAGDDVGVASVEFQIDGAPAGEARSAPYAVSVDTADHADGQHVVRARAHDTAGQVSPWSSATVRLAGGGGAPAGFTLTEAWVTGLARPTAFAQAPDGRLFVAEQDGTLRVVRDGTLRPTPFHRFAVDAAGERGLLGVALDPDFAANGIVYVHYTTATAPVHNRISRLVASGDVSTGAEVVLVDLPSLSGATNHNGGALHVGPDGMLYLGVGDNASPARAQDPADPFGKILRLDRNGRAPPDNPFCTAPTELRCAVWAIGLRNPFTFAFQPGTGRLHINDVGQDAWEEVDLGRAGANYGWPGIEGPGTAPPGVTAPLFAYPHTPSTPPGAGPGGFLTGNVISGGAFYPAAGAFPAHLGGNYVFADLAGRWIARLDLADDGAVSTFAHVQDTPVDLLVGQDGALYVLGYAGGTIARIAAR